MNPRTARLTSADGYTLFYTIPIEGAAESFCGNGTPNPIGLFARIGATPPIQLNAPPPAQCSSPHPAPPVPSTTPLYYGASPDGSRAWFTTTQPLIDSDTDTTNDLYLAKLENGHLAELVQASAGEATLSPHSPAKAPASRASSASPRTASHAAFVATGVLTTHPNALDQSAVQGADNLYVYDAQSGETKFVTRLCSGPEKSGSVADPACPATLKSFFEAHRRKRKRRPSGFQREPRAPISPPDGRYLLFTSYGRLTPDDTDNVPGRLPLRLPDRPAHPRLLRPQRQRRQRQRQRLPGRNRTPCRQGRGT